MSVVTTTIEVPTPDGAADALLAAPTDGGPHPGVLLYMDAFGLRPRIEEMAARLAGEGYVVLAPNVFYRSGRAPVVELGDLTSPEGRHAMFEQLGPLMAALTPDLAMRDARAYLAALEADERVSDGPVGTVGYCMGGALALRTAAEAPDRVAAAASFHGGRLATDAPDSPHRSFGRIAGEVYVGHADHDGSMPPEQQQLVAKTLADAGVDHRAELYEGAQHGFTMADTAAYDPAATERHWERLSDLFRRCLAG
ncbi:dienelactone hydrolase family protein [Nocardioides mesophilus]|uniref:Dienelactone hydrolase family protein n=1 Tax=Nocardioides mesophilus TaxID=433659 RepID=A0A7G9REU1_9ACTN|nr:dienelactone hydrolase family protein [Nocardioides mesophilus]QNN54116.1 dienelactone hydrolase family protein [Nocardioides mesophilus]